MLRAICSLKYPALRSSSWQTTKTSSWNFVIQRQKNLRGHVLDPIKCGLELGRTRTNHILTCPQQLRIRQSLGGILTNQPVDLVPAFSTTPFPTRKQNKYLKIFAA